MADPLETACSLVGRFQYHFGRVEQKIDQAVIKLLDLDDKAGPIVTGSVAFASKVNFVRTSAYQQAVNDKDKQLAEKTCDDVFAVNVVRQIVIHSSFEPHDGGVQFRRTVARDGRVRVDDQVWSGEKFSEHFSTMRKLETVLIDLRDFGRTSVCESPWRLGSQGYLQGPSAAAAVFPRSPLRLAENTRVVRR
jgi:hypothetical protein